MSKPKQRCPHCGERVKVSFRTAEELHTEYDVLFFMCDTPTCGMVTSFRGSPTFTDATARFERRTEAGILRAPWTPEQATDAEA